MSSTPKSQCVIEFAQQHNIPLINLRMAALGNQNIERLVAQYGKPAPVVAHEENR